MIQPKKQTRGEGVQNPENFANVINGCPLTLVQLLFQGLREGMRIFDKRIATKWDSENQQNEKLDMRQNWQHRYLRQNVTFRNWLATKWFAALATKDLNVMRRGIWARGKGNVLGFEITGKLGQLVCNSKNKFPPTTNKYDNRGSAARLSDTADWLKLEFASVD